MVSCLEKYSMEARHEMEIRSEYARNNRYGVTHENALSTGTEKGKGTGHGGHRHWLPNCTSQIGVFDYSNFDTSIKSHPGNKTDNEARERMMGSSLYSPWNPYPYANIDTSANVAEGQYQIK